MGLNFPVSPGRWSSMIETYDDADEDDGNPFKLDDVEPFAYGLFDVGEDLTVIGDVLWFSFMDDDIINSRGRFRDGDWEYRIVDDGSIVLLESTLIVQTFVCLLWLMGTGRWLICHECIVTQFQFKTYILYEFQAHLLI